MFVHKIRLGLKNELFTWQKVYNIKKNPMFLRLKVTIIIVIFKQDQKGPFTYRKILKISPGAYIFQRPFLRGLFLEGLI